MVFKGKEEGIINLKEKKKKISNDLQGEEHIRFISLSTKFPKLFISSCSKLKGADVMKHHIKLKESVPIAQKLRRFGILQKEDLIKEFKELLHGSFIYHMEHLKCMSLIVVVPKKNDINFKPLNDSTKQDRFSLPF